MKLVGRVTLYGYIVMDYGSGEILYQAGNSTYGSKQTVNPRYGLPLSLLEEYCKQTLQEIAKESAAEILNVRIES